MKKTQITDAKVVLLGTGTPNPDPNRSGPCVALVADGQSYLVDAGVGVVRQAEKAHRLYGLEALSASQLKRVFLTHLHSDHTLGLPDLIYTPWVLERDEPLEIYGPIGARKMVEHLLAAYQDDIHARKCGLEGANEAGIGVIVHEIGEGEIYADDSVRVEAFRVDHPPFDAFGFRFSVQGKTVVISGDTAPSASLIHHAKECDVLLHEVISAAGVLKRDPKWRKYHSTVHTDSKQLAEIAAEANPKKLIFYHQLFMTAPDATGRMVTEDEREVEMIADVRAHFSGEILSAKDLDWVALGF